MPAPVPAPRYIMSRRIARGAPARRRSIHNFARAVSRCVAKISGRMDIPRITGGVFGMAKLRPIRRPWNEARPGDILAIVADLPSIVQAIRCRADACGFSLLALDQYSGLSAGHTSKIFCGDKNIGPLSFAVLLAATGLKLAVVADQAPIPPLPKDKKQDRFPPSPPYSVEIAA
jgi:hypothetical protein